MDLSNESNPYYSLRDQDLVDWHLWKRSTVEFARSQGKDLRVVIGSYYSQDAHFLEKSRYRDPEFARSLNETYINVIVDRDELPAFEHFYRSIFIWMLWLPDVPQLRFEDAILPMVLALDSQTLYPKGLRNEKYSLDVEVREGPYTDYKLIVDEPDAESGSQKASQPTQRRKSKLEITFKGYQRRQRRRPVEIDLDALDFFREQLEDLRSDRDPSRSFLKTNIVKHGKIADYLIQDARARSGGKLREWDLAPVMLRSLAQSPSFDHLRGGFFQMKREDSHAVPVAEKRLTVSAYLLEVYCRALSLMYDEELGGVAGLTATFLVTQLTPEYTFPATVTDLSREDSSHYAWDKRKLKRLLTEDEFRVIEILYGLHLAPNYHGSYLLETISSSYLGSDYLDIEPDRDAALYASAYEKIMEARNDSVLVADDRFNPLTCAAVSKALGIAAATLDDPLYFEVAKRVMDMIVEKFNPIVKDGEFDTSGSDGITLKPVDALFIIDALLVLLEYEWHGRWYEMIQGLWLKLMTFGLEESHEAYRKPQFWGTEKPADFIAVPDFVPIFDYQLDRLGETAVLLNVARKLDNLRYREFSVCWFDHISPLERTIERFTDDHVEYLQLIAIWEISDRSIILRGPIEKCRNWKAKLRIPANMDCPIYVIPYDAPANRHMLPEFLRTMDTNHSVKRVTAFFVGELADEPAQFTNLTKLNAYLRKPKYSWQA